MIKMDVLRENSNENIYDTIHPRASSIKEKDINTSLFSRVFSLLYTRTRSNLFSSTDSISSEKGDVKISIISPRNENVTCVYETHEPFDTSLKETTLHEITRVTESYENPSILERIQYYNTLCEMANILRHIYYYFKCDIPIFIYKSFEIIGNGHLVFHKGHHRHITDLEKYRIFKIDDSVDDRIDDSVDHHNTSRETAKGGISTIYHFLLQYKMFRTKNNYPILVYKYFVWYESYIYMRTIPINYILHSNLSNGPIGCNVCKEYAHPTLKIFQNYCEYCFKEIKSRIDESNQDHVPETNI